MDALLDNSVIVIVVNAILTILAVFGVSLVGFKKILTAIKETADVPVLFTQALADDKFTEEEVAEIRKAIDEATGAWKDIVTVKR